MFVHGHGIGGVDNGNAVSGITELGEAFLDLGFRSAQDHVNIGILIDGVYGAFNNNISSYP